MKQEPKKKNKYNKVKFMVAFFVTMALFATVRHGFSIDIPLKNETDDDLTAVESYDEDEWVEETMTIGEEEMTKNEDITEEEVEDNLLFEDSTAEDSAEEADITPEIPASQLQKNGHRVMGVYSWREAFPDSQVVQLSAAQKNGIVPCSTRGEVMRLVKRHKLVNISHSPFYMVDDLTHSVPYLVPKAQQLLNTICLNFMDSLQCKGIPPHLPMVTSVLRTTDDVSKLQKRNRNATENSCHCYGTTVDITYNRFVPLTGKYDESVELLRWNLQMKQVLAEVLRDLREQGLCYVKYEYKQACFHLTVR